MQTLDPLSPRPMSPQQSRESMPDLLTQIDAPVPGSPPGNGALKSQTRPIRRRWPGRIVKFSGIAAAAGLVIWAAMTWWLPTRQMADLITAVATRGDLVINVTERGELDSAKSIQVVCEIEGGGKVA